MSRMSESIYRDNADAEDAISPPRILVPFDKCEAITLSLAATIAGKSQSTLRYWCEQHGLGRKVGGGNWLVSRPALAMYLDGDLKALRAYHSGDRESELVASYFKRHVKRNA